jgi:hypothetical protein
MPSAYARVYVSFFATSVTGTVVPKRPSVAPTDAACGSVKTVRGTAS